MMHDQLTNEKFVSYPNILQKSASVNGMPVAR